MKVCLGRGPDLSGRSLRFFSKFDGGHWIAERDSDFAAFRVLRVPGLEDIILAAVHLLSKCNDRSPEQQRIECSDVAAMAADLEKERRHTRTVVIGDFNVDPFEPGMLHADGLFAMIAFRDAEVGVRTIRQKSYQPFYNPMWSLYGDIGGRAPGTCRFVHDDVNCAYWHMHDQVIVRPALGRQGIKVEILQCYSDAHGKVMSLSNDAGDSPDAESFSDHFPLLVTITLRKDNGDACS